jgi:hypothetical protein
MLVTRMAKAYQEPSPILEIRAQVCSLHDLPILQSAVAPLFSTAVTPRQSQDLARQCQAALRPFSRLCT